jgi:hypothetical protein
MWYDGRNRCRNQDRDMPTLSQNSEKKNLTTMKLNFEDSMRLLDFFNKIDEKEVYDEIIVLSGTLYKITKIK